MLKFITSKPLWIQILIGGILFFVLVFIFFQSLSMITRHDSVLPVPAVTGKPFEEAKKFLEGQGFDVQVQDTVYADSLPLSSVVKQFPEPETVVKMNRTIFLSINSAAPPDVPMPQLEGSTFKSAMITMQQLGLKLEDTSYVQNIARDQVLEQRFKGEVIKPGTKIPMGSGISLVLGRGLGNESIDVPDLFGMTLADARSAIEGSGMTMGNVVPQGAGDGSYVFRQSPDHMSPGGNVNKARGGQYIDIWVQAARPERVVADTASGGY